MTRLLLLLGMIAGGLLLLFINHSGGQSFGLRNEDFARLVYLLPLATLIGTGILASRRHLGRNLAFLLAWAAIAALIIGIYVYKDDATRIAHRMVAELVPGHPVVLTGLNGETEVLLRKTQDGHFTVNAKIDGHTVGMLVDTGATEVTLTWQDAKMIGIDPQALDYSVQVTTANGTAQTAPVQIKEIAIGPIVRRNVRASVAEKGKLDASLLGMNFLSTLSAVRMEPGEMRLMD